MISIKLLITYFLTQVYVISVASQTTKDTSNSSLYRLPTSIRPISYNITILTNVTRGDFRYKGVVNINLNVTNEAKEIVLHSHKLTINQEQSVMEKVTASKAETLKIQAQTYENETQFYKIIFGNFITTGEYRLTLYFDGEVVDDYFGFYRSSYIKDKQRRWIGVTQLSPVYARRAFPCMDEPAFKATFQLNLGHFSNDTVSSNTLAESKQLIRADKKLGDYYITRFARTPRMSTYLLAWAIHDFKQLNSTKSYMWLWTRSQTLKPNNSPIILKGPSVETVLEKYTGISNPLRKFEQVAVPDYYFQAMENWGMITYREPSGLIDYNSTPSIQIFNELNTESHEYSHTYFGNLVTPRFWDVAWLKEGFAVYFSYLNFDLLYEDWRTMEIFKVLELQSALLADSFPERTRTMNGRGVGSISTVMEALDTITYSKGASILGMFANALGKESFQRAVQSYLKRWQYEAVTPKELYQELNAVANGLPATVGEMFDSWANQTNYPLLKPTRVGNKVTITQRSFDFSGNDKSNRWWIPITILAANFESKLQWLPNNNKSISVELPENSTWFVVNPHLNGYYRVDYEMKNWDALISLLKTGSLESLPSLSRAALLDDAFNLWRVNLRNNSLLMSLAEYVTREQDYIPWFTISQIINILDQSYQNRPDALKAFRQFSRKIITPIYKVLTTGENSNDSFIRKMHRELILTASCTVGLESCVSAAKSVFDKWIANENNKIPKYFKAIAYKIGVTNGTDQDWENLYARFLQTDSSNLDKEIMINALLSTNNSSYLQRLVKFANTSESDIARQYRDTIVQSVREKNITTTSNDAQNNSSNTVSLMSDKLPQKVSPASQEEGTIVEQEVESNILHRGTAAERSRRMFETAADYRDWVDRSAKEILEYLNNHNL